MRLSAKLFFIRTNHKTSSHSKHLLLVFDFSPLVLYTLGHKIIILIDMTVFMVLSSWHATAIARVHPVHLMNAQQRLVAANPQTKPIVLSQRSASRPLGNYNVYIME